MQTAILDCVASHLALSSTRDHAAPAAVAISTAGSVVTRTSLYARSLCLARARVLLLALSHFLNRHAYALFRVHSFSA